MKSALVLGGAGCVFEDAVAALELFTPDLTIAVNDIIGTWSGHLDIAATLHPEKLHHWLNERRSKGFNDPETWAHKLTGPNGKIEAQIDHATNDWKGSSGLFAVKIAIELGCDRIVAAGVPMDAGRAHFFSDRDWNDATGFLNGWRSHQAKIAPYFRSMSGWTAEQFGRPDASWLARAA